MTTARQGRKQLGQKLVFTSTLVQVEGGGVIKLRCGKCHHLKELKAFGTRVMGDGTIRNQPQCSECRSNKKQKN